VTQSHLAQVNGAEDGLVQGIWRVRLRFRVY